MICYGEEDERGDGDGSVDDGERFRSSGWHDVVDVWRFVVVVVVKLQIVS